MESWPSVLALGEGDGGSKGGGAVEGGSGLDSDSP